MATFTGVIFNAASAPQTAQATACSFAVPFKVGVHFDEEVTLVPYSQYISPNSHYPGEHQSRPHRLSQPQHGGERSSRHQRRGLRLQRVLAELLAELLLISLRTLSSLIIVILVFCTYVTMY